MAVVPTSWADADGCPRRTEPGLADRTAETTMDLRKLGGSGIEVSAIGLGCWGMSGSYGPADEAESVATLHHALDLGVNFLDTADSYGDGHNERLIGRTLKDRRHEFVLATKTGWVKRPGPDGKEADGVDGRPERIRSACEASLTRLRTDVIDLYYLHRVDPDVPVEESVGGMAELVAAGKVRFLGLSEVSEATLRRAHAVHPITALQSEYSLWTREPETTVMPACRELGIAYVPFSPLGRGFLTGAVTGREAIAPGDWRMNNPRFTDENLARNQALLQPLEEIAQVHGARLAQIALAWVLSRGENVIPIPGMKRRTHLDENVAAGEIKLTPAELTRLDAVFPVGAAAGERYTPEVARWAGR
jgi:aryl-alcohol dehydrogenase-like predicted oxidoreductase